MHTEGTLGSVTDTVLGAFYHVYNELGTGFLESTYEAAMSMVLDEMGTKVERQAPLSVMFRGQLIGTFKIDLLVEGSVAVEIKARKQLEPAHEAQLLHYLRASDIEVGLLLNFGPRPTVKRMRYSNDRRKAADPTTAR